MATVIGFRIYTTFVHREVEKVRDKATGKTQKQTVLSLRLRSVDIPDVPSKEVMQSHIIRVILEDNGITYLEEI